MKKLIFSTLVGSLLALAGCQQNEEIMDNSNTNGEKVTVTANIKGATDSRVALTPDNTDPNAPYVKVAWKESGEKFNVYSATGDVQEFTQASENQFSGTLPATTNDYYMASYNCTYTYDVDSEELELLYDLSQQNGTLNESYVMMSCEAEDTDPLTFNFKHHTFILKPTFKVGEETLANNTITKIVMGTLEMPKANDWDVETITIEREASAGDIYIFVPQTRKPFSNYYTNKKIPFEVTAGGKEYTAEFTITNTSEIGLLAGYLYTATVTLTPKAPAIPYVTFSASGAQKFKMTGMNNIPEQDGKLYYSIDNGATWPELKAVEGQTYSPEIPFGNGTDLLLKGNLTKGTGYLDAAYYDLPSKYLGATVSFTTEETVACTGDIRTLIAGDDYDNTTGNEAAFCALFKDCTQLTSAPQMPPATALPNGCYGVMFYGCTGLTTAPALPAENLAPGCYAHMFYKCTGLTTAPALPAMDLTDKTYCYGDMFYECSSLETAPALPATTLAEKCYMYMFSKCENLTSVPETLPAATLLTDCYRDMFNGCSSLETAPAISATTMGASCCYQMFRDCTSMVTAPALPAMNLANNCYEGMFSGCTGLKNPPALPATTLANYCYGTMFYGCTGLVTGPTMSATTLAEYCCYNMFNSCSNLGTAPVLEAETLVNNCYRQMFQNCSKLSSVTMLATNVAERYYDNDLMDWLKGAATNGTLYKNSSCTALQYQYKLPTLWTLSDYNPAP